MAFPRRRSARLPYSNYRNDGQKLKDCCAGRQLTHGLMRRVPTISKLILPFSPKPRNSSKGKQCYGALLVLSENINRSYAERRIMSIAAGSGQTAGFRVFVSQTRLSRRQATLSRREPTARRAEERCCKALAARQAFFWFVPGCATRSNV